MGRMRKVHNDTVSSVGPAVSALWHLVGVIALWLCLAPVAWAAGPYPPLSAFQSVTDVRSFTIRGKSASVTYKHTLRYRLYVPDKYNDPASSNTSYPLVLFLHGLGERGTDNEKQIKAHNGSHEFVSPTNRVQYPTFFMAPQYYDVSVSIPETDGTTTKRNYSGWHTLVRTHMVEHITQVMLKKYRIDSKRLYLTGLSMGGAGSWFTLGDHPTLFAAVVPLCGWGPNNKAAAMKDVPIWAFHAADDPVVNVSGTDKMINAIKQAGGMPLYTRYTTGGHAIWGKTYNDPKLIPWIFGHALTNPVPIPPKITKPGSLSNGEVNKPLQVAFQATGTTPLTWSVSSGTLPAGLNLDASSGQYRGTPTKAGKFTFAVTVTNKAGKDTRNYTHTILASQGEPAKEAHPEPSPDAGPDEPSSTEESPDGVEVAKPDAFGETVQEVGSAEREPHEGGRDAGMPDTPVSSEILKERFSTEMRSEGGVLPERLGDGGGVDSPSVGDDPPEASAASEEETFSVSGCGCDGAGLPGGRTLWLLCFVWLLVARGRKRIPEVR